MADDCENLPLAGLVDQFFAARRSRKDSVYTVKAYRGHLAIVCGHLAAIHGTSVAGLTAGQKAKRALHLWTERDVAILATLLMTGRAHRSCYPSPSGRLSACPASGAHLAHLSVGGVGLFLGALLDLYAVEYRPAFEILESGVGGQVGVRDR